MRRALRFSIFRPRWVAYALGRRCKIRVVAGCRRSRGQSLSGLVTVLDILNTWLPVAEVLLSSTRLVPETMHPVANKPTGNAQFRKYKIYGSMAKLPSR